MRISLLLAVGAPLLTCGAVAAQTQAVKTTDVITKMVEAGRQGFYEESIQAGMSALENKSSDDVILRQIAIVYLMRADKNPEHSEEWVKQAVIFADKSLAVNPAIDFGRYELARIFEQAADRAQDGKCSLYGRARKSIAEWSSTLKGNTVTIEGKSIPVEFLVKQADATKSSIDGKLAQSHCK